MAVTILEALQNADHNLRTAWTSSAAVIQLASKQLHNAVELLARGYDLRGTEVEPILEEWGAVESVPPVTELDEERRGEEWFNHRLDRVIAYIAETFDRSRPPDDFWRLVDAIEQLRGYYGPEGE
jgi:hypothetical protein